MTTFEYLEYIDAKKWNANYKEDPNVPRKRPNKSRWRKCGWEVEPGDFDTVERNRAGSGKTAGEMVQKDAKPRPESILEIDS